MVYNDLMSVRSLRRNRIGGSKKAARVSSTAVRQVASNLWLVFGSGYAMQPRGFSQLVGPPRTGSQTPRHSVNLDYLSVRADPEY